MPFDILMPLGILLFAVIVVVGLWSADRRASRANRRP